MMTKKEAVRAILDGEGADRIPEIMNIVSLSVDRYGYSMMDVMTSPEKYTECVMGTRERLGFDGLCGGILAGHTADMAGHLPSSEREISGDGEDTIHCMEDLEKLKPVDPEKCMNLKGVLANIAIMKEKAPEEPIYVIMMPPTGVAFSLIGAKSAFKAMVKNPEFFKAVAEKVEDIQFTLSKILWDAGIDFLWYSEPNFGGYCISRKSYEKCISESNIRFFNRLKDAGIKFVIHTCGIYDDRFDLVLKENANAWHISDTQTKKVKDLYGEQVSIMGNIPCVPVLMNGTKEQVYDFVYQDCLDGARDGRFILSGDCDIAPPTDDDNIREAIRAAKDAEEKLFGEASPIS